LKVKTVIPLLLLAGVGFFAYRWWAPSEETQIRKELREAARLISTQPEDSGIARLFSARRLAGFFDTNVVINVDIEREHYETVTSADELFQQIVAARRQLRRLKVRFVDIALKFNAEKTAAVANLTALADVNGEEDAAVQELKLLLRKTPSGWKVAQLETVRVVN